MIAEDLSLTDKLYTSLDFAFNAHLKQRAKPDDDLIMNIEESKAAVSLPKSAIEESKEAAKTLTKTEELIQKFGPFKSSIDIKTEQFTEVISVVDWEPLMPRYKPEFLPQIKRAQASPQKFEQRWNLPDWREVINDKKEGLLVWVRNADEGCATFKATGIINRSTQQIFRVIGDDKYRKMYDPIYDTGSFIERIADQTFLIYHKTKQVFVVGARDFVLILHFNMTPEGVIYALVMESDRNDLWPESKGIVRGVMPIGGWKFTPVPGEPNKTRCDYLAELNLKGSIPGFIMKTAIKDQGYQICKLRKAVECYLKDHNLI